MAYKRKVFYFPSDEERAEAEAALAEAKAAGTVREIDDRRAEDTRTTKSKRGKYWRVRPLYVGARFVWIVCPFCGELHAYDRRRPENFDGHVRAHCVWLTFEAIMNGLFIV